MIKTLKLPLHLPQDAWWPSALAARFDLHQKMLALRPNGEGFRKVPSSKKGAKSIVKQKNKAPTTTLERLAQLMLAQDE